MRIEMLKVVLDMSNEETYKESLSELFDYDDEAAHASFDKNYEFGVGVNITRVVWDAFHKPHIREFNYELHDLGDKKTLLVVAYVEVE